MKQTLDTPLTRLQAKYEAKLAEKDAEIEDMRLQAATVHSINEMLKFELRTIESLMKGLQKSIDDLREHVRVLKTNLPD